jgi:hypothetical protein
MVGSTQFAGFATGHWQTILKHLLASVATINHVVADLSNRCLCASWHATIPLIGISFRKEKEIGPFFLARSSTTNIFAAHSVMP